MRSLTSDLVEEPHHPSVTPPSNPDDLDTRRRAPSGLTGAYVPEVGLVSLANMHLDPHDGTVGVRGLAGTSHLMSAQRGWADVPTQLRTHHLPGTPHIFPWGKVRKTHQNQHLQHQKMRSNPAQGDHQEKCQRSAPQSAQKCVPKKKTSLLNSVLGENLEEVAGHAQRRQDGRHFHQLFR